MRIVTTSGEVILLAGDGRCSPTSLRAIGERVHAHTRALVITDAVGGLQISKLDRDEMRRHGWVRIDEPAADTAGQVRQACGDSNPHGPHDGCDGIPLPPIEPTT